MSIGISSLILMQITGIVMAPQTMVSLAAHVWQLIAETHSLHFILTILSHRSAITWYTFQSVLLHALSNKDSFDLPFGGLEVRIIPIHCITHNSCGPHSHIWCMRFEAKHHFKYLAKESVGKFQNSYMSSPAAYYVLCSGQSICFFSWHSGLRSR